MKQSIITYPVFVERTLPALLHGGRGAQLLAPVTHTEDLLSWVRISSWTRYL